MKNQFIFLERSKYF